MTDSQNRPKRLSLDWWTSLSGALTAVGTVVAVIALVVAIMALPDAEPDGQAQATPSGSPAPQSDLAHTPTLGLSLWQNGHQVPMTDYSNGQTHGDFVTRIGAAMESAPFEIHFPRPAQSDIFRINAWKTTTNFNIPVGAKAEDTVFRWGRQRPGTPRPNGIMTLDDGSHEFIDSDGMERIDNDKLSVRYAKFDVPSAVPAPTAFPDHVYEPSEATLTAVADWHDRVCVTIWQDVNHDSIVGDGEYEYLILVFPGTPGT